MIKYYKLLIILVLLLIISLIIILFKAPWFIRQACRDETYELPLTLQSGEVGKIFITGNQCSVPLASQFKLVFKVLPDQAIEDSIYQSRLYIWARNQLTIEEQIQTIAQANNKVCEVIKNDYPQHDGLTTYQLVGDNCFVFGQESPLSSEVFMENNGLLILQKQSGFDGLEPFALSSIRFIR
jgi:hypothetical protein